MTHCFICYILCITDATQKLYTYYREVFRSMYITHGGLYMKKILILTLLISVFITGCGTNNKGAEDMASKLNITNSFISDLTAENYESLVNDYAYSDDMKKAVNIDLYKDLIKNNAIGDLVEILPSTSEDVKGYQAVTTSLKYSGSLFSLVLYFDKTNVIYGVSVSEFQDLSGTPSTVVEKEKSLNINGVTLRGTLTLPKEGNNFSCVILVHGSGSTDQDETISANKPFRDMAWGLAERGIASYRYDKRGFSYPEMSEDTTLTLREETIDDAVESLKKVSEMNKIDADKIFVLGHSLGGYAMPLIAEETSDAKGYIIMAGLARSLQEAMNDQIHYLTSLDGKITDEEKASLDFYDSEIEKFSRLKELDEKDTIFNTYTTYWNYLENYDPIETAKGIDKNVLVLQGMRDYQVTMEDYNRWYDAFNTKENWHFRTYDTLNHLMMPGEGVPSPEEYFIKSSVDQQVIEDISTWINSIK